MISRTFMLVFVLGYVGLARAQSESASKAASDSPAAESAQDKSDTPDPKHSTIEPTKETIRERAAQMEQFEIEMKSRMEREMKILAEKMDKDPTANRAAAGILQPIYAVAETLAFPAFHWLAFGLMAAGVVSFTLQLALGKLVVLMRMGLSFKEIASDAVGLAISVVGLVLTTQAAAENSTFTQSPAAVISATAVGAVVGIILYIWGQAQELEAVAGRTRTAAPTKR